MPASGFHDPVLEALQSAIASAVCTIHQPSIDIFEAFDELVLLKRGGETIYCGPLGLHSADLIKYFSVSVFHSPFRRRLTAFTLQFSADQLAFEVWLVRQDLLSRVGRVQAVETMKFSISPSAEELIHITDAGNQGRSTNQGWHQSCHLDAGSFYPRQAICTVRWDQ